MNEKYDVIVIGAGLGGLSAAARMARSGKRVLVLEHHSVPGGYAHEFRRGKFRFDVALHALDGMAPGGWGYDAIAATGRTPPSGFPTIRCRTILRPKAARCFPFSRSRRWTIKINRARAAS